MLSKTTLKVCVLAGAVLLLAVVQIPRASATQAVVYPPHWLGPEFKITSDVVAEGQEWYQPDVVYNPNRGLYFVVAHADLGTGHSIHGQHVTQGGGLADWLWTVYGPFEGIEVLQPAVAYNSYDRDYLIVWMRRQTDGEEGYEIWGRIIDELGFTAGDPFMIFSWANRSLSSPRVAYNAFRNEYFVVWNAFDSSGGLPGVPNDISGCRLTAGGAAIAPCPTVITTDVNPHQVDIAYNYVWDRYFAVWVRSYSATATGNDVYGAVLSRNGVVVSPPGVIVIDEGDDNDDAPAVTANAQGYYNVAWQHGFAGNYSIHMQEYDGAGEPYGYPHIQGYASWDDVRPAITEAHGSNTWLMAWEVVADTNSFLRTARWGPGFTGHFTVMDAAFWEVGSPAVATGDATFLIVYEGDSIGDPSVDRHIYGRIFAEVAIYLPLMLQGGP
jgi:hypothetical protein